MEGSWQGERVHSDRRCSWQLFIFLENSQKYLGNKKNTFASLLSLPGQMKMNFVGETMGLV